jgi:hypothetical protein
MNTGHLTIWPPRWQQQYFVQKESNNNINALFWSHVRCMLVCPRALRGMARTYLCTDALHKNNSQSVTTEKGNARFTDRGAWRVYKNYR